MKLKSPIIYYGGKTSMLPNILPLIPPHRVYTEVFAGGAAVLWAKDKSQIETINDTLDLVVNFYTVLKTKFSALRVLIECSLFSRYHHAKALMIIRHKELFNDVELAWAFWMCSNFSYGNKIGGGLKYSNDVSIVPAKVLSNAKKFFTEILVDRIECLHIEKRDALMVLDSRNVEDAFHYIDPPYPGTDQGHYRGYSWNDLERLLNTCSTLNGKFLLSNYDSDLLDEFVENNGWWKKTFIVNNKGMRKKDAPKTEVLIANYNPVSKLTLF